MNPSKAAAKKKPCIAVTNKPTIMDTQEGIIR